MGKRVQDVMLVTDQERAALAAAESGRREYLQKIVKMAESELSWALGKSKGRWTTAAMAAREKLEGARREYKSVAGRRG